MIALSIVSPPPTPNSAPTAPPSVKTADFLGTLTGLSEAPASGKTPVAQGPTPGLPTSGLPKAGLAKPGMPDVSRLSDPETPVTLAAFLNGVGDDPAPVAPPAAKGQDVAANGKTLPADTAEHDTSKDVIWLPAAFALPVQLPLSQPRGLPKFGAPIISVAGDTAPVAPPAVTPPAALPAGDGGGKPAVLTLPPDIGPDILIAGDAGPAPGPRVTALPVSPDDQAGRKVDVPLRPDATVAITVPVTAGATPQATVTQPASQAFAAAIASVVQQARRDEREPADQHTPIAITASALEALHGNAVAATADAKHAALDLKQDSGMQGMIDHIETLRDGADANDTRIRLVPDALGAVDVSVRKDGERVHVHFAAENRASAQLLSDAQPRLAELAEARGVKLGQTSVDSGQTQGQARQQPLPNPIPSTRPASALGAADLHTTDSRIA